MADVMICPTARDGDEEVAREWASGALAPAAATEFEEHLLTCGRCQEAVQSASRFTAALRAAAKEHRVRQSRISVVRWVMVAGAAVAAATAAFLATQP